MNNFSYILNEVNSKSIVSESNGDNGYITPEVLDQYISSMGKKIPSTVQTALYLTKKYNLLSDNEIDEIKDASKSRMGSVAKKYNMSLNDFNTLYDLLKTIGHNIKLLPQYQSEAETKSIMKGKLTIDDLTVDLDTPKGRNDATKMYMPLVYKIVNQYVGKSKLGRPELISAGLMGFTKALNEYRRNDKDGKRVTFKTYASYRVQQEILNDINNYGHTLSGTNWYATKKFGAGLLDAMSLDGTGMKDDEGEFKNDRLAALGEGPEPLDRDEEKEWTALYRLLDSTFNNRDTNIFYRYFGLHGYKKEKSKDIAKSYGMSEGNIRNSIINKMIKFLKNDPKSGEILSNIMDMYNESLMCSLVGMDADFITETLVNDDIFILLEELNRWNNKDVFMHSLYLAYENIKKSDIEIINIIINGDFSVLDDMYKKNKKVIVKFLKEMYPTENISRKTDVALLEYMTDIQNAYKKYKTK